MEEKYEQDHPLAPATTTTTVMSDEELATVPSKELKKKKRIKCAIYIVAFAIFQTAVIAAFALTVMKIKTPKVRFGSVTVQRLTATGSSNGTAPSFKASFTAQLTVKNTNFGHYKFDANTVTFYYGGEAVGTVAVPSARARARSTKSLDVAVSVDSSGLKRTARLGTEIDSDTLTLTSQVELNGKVQLMKVFKKKQSAKMSCVLSLNVSAKSVQDLKCE